MAYNPFQWGISVEDMALQKTLTRTPRAPLSATSDEPDERIGIVPGIQSVTNPLPARGVKASERFAFDLSHIEKAGGTVTRFKDLEKKFSRPDDLRENAAILYGKHIPLPRRKRLFTSRIIDPVTRADVDESVRRNKEWERLAIQRARGVVVPGIEEMPFDPRHQRTGRTILVQLLSLFGLS